MGWWCFYGDLDFGEDEDFGDIDLLAERNYSEDLIDEKLQKMEIWILEKTKRWIGLGDRLSEAHGFFK